MQCSKKRQINLSYNLEKSAVEMVSKTLLQIVETIVNGRK